MLSIYLIAALAALLLSLSLQSIKAGVFFFLLTLTACDVAVGITNTGSYVGPMLVARTIQSEVEWFSLELQKAALKRAAYDSCVESLHTRVWDDESQVLSSLQIHHYCSSDEINKIKIENYSGCLNHFKHINKSLENECLKVAAERSLP